MVMTSVVLIELSSFGAESLLNSLQQERLSPKINRRSYPSPHYYLGDEKKKTAYLHSLLRRIPNPGVFTVAFFGGSVAQGICHLDYKTRVLQKVVQKHYSQKKIDLQCFALGCYRQPQSTIQYIFTVTVSILQSLWKALMRWTQK
jgi:hypothetical protein